MPVSSLIELLLPKKLAGSSMNVVLENTTFLGTILAEFREAVIVSSFTIDEVSIAYISGRAIDRGLLTHIDEGNKKKAR